jgi:hypothetical protein
LKIGQRLMQEGLLRPSKKSRAEVPASDPKNFSDLLGSEMPSYLTFNQRVAGSRPTGLTIKINDLDHSLQSREALRHPLRHPAGPTGSLCIQKSPDAKGRGAPGLLGTTS